MDFAQCSRDGCEGRLERRDYTARRKVAGQRFEVPSEVLVCPECGREVISYAEAHRVSLVIAGELASHGPLTGAAFRHMRRSLELTGRQVADVLRVVPETISRWEHEQQAIPASAVLLLGTIVLESLVDEDGRSETLERATRLVA